MCGATGQSKSRREVHQLQFDRIRIPIDHFDFDSRPAVGAGEDQAVGDRQRGNRRAGRAVPNPEFFEIVYDFILKLNTSVFEMYQCIELQNFSKLANQAHWLKGSGGTCGFDALYAPSCKLENAALRANELECMEYLNLIREVALRIQMPQKV